MLAEIGYFILVVAFSTAVFGVFAAIWGVRQKNDFWIESARRVMVLSFPLVSVAVISLMGLIFLNDFQVQYVYSVSSRSTPFYLKLAAIWGGQSGSLLFWSWMIAICTFLVARRDWHAEKEMLPWVSMVMLITQAFFLALVIFFENPFVRYWFIEAGSHIVAMFQPSGYQPLIPYDGNGLNPLLRHPGMIFHPPALYIGFVAFIVPYAFAVAALVTNNLEEDWIRITRKWTFVAWIFLSIGLILGARWAYDVLGWGGYWGWDPVEIAALMPWLTGTAFIHSIMIQERRGLFKRWNIILILITYSLVIFGTFLTRSGVLSSVHSFSQSAIGPSFFVFIGVTFLITLGLILYRWNNLESKGYIQSIFSREGLFLINNFLLMSIFFVCFWGVIFPIISEVVIGQKAVVGPPFYKKATGPLFAALILLMGVAPLSVWGYSSLKRMGKNSWKLMIVTLVILAFLIFRGIHQWQALLGFGVSIFAGLITIVEYIRGILMRKKRTGENVFTAAWQQTLRNRSRYGGYFIHIGVLMIAAAVIGIELFQSETQATLSVGEQVTLNEYTLTYEKMSNFDTMDGRNIALAYLRATDQNGHTFYVYPRRDYYYNSQQAVTIPGVRTNLKDDVYSVLIDWDPFVTQKATFKIYQNPLVVWLWIGGIVFILGSLLAISRPEKLPIEEMS